MMIVNRVPELLAARFGGADKVNMSEVQKDTRLTYATVHKWVKGNPTATRIDSGALEAWCKYLGVQPGDILAYEPDEQ